MHKMKVLLSKILKCEVCENFLEQGVNPVLSAHSKSKIVIIGQAPGIKVHKSGERLRSWLNVNADIFYNEEIFAIIPMGFLLSRKRKIWRFST